MVISFWPLPGEELILYKGQGALDTGLEVPPDAPSHPDPASATMASGVFLNLILPPLYTLKFLYEGELGVGAKTDFPCQK